MVKRVVGMLVLLLVGLLPVTATAEFTKTKIAVLDFQMQGEPFENEDMGAIVAEWFITAMVKEGRFDVIERRLLEKILSEQRLSMSGIIDETSATQIGKLLGVKVIISGSVMKVRDVLEVNARIIDVENASIIAAESVRSSTASRLQDLIVEMSGKIIKNFPLEGYIVNRTDQKVTIDLGNRAGVKAGMIFTVYREGDAIKHPKTGEVLDVERINTGRIEIKSVLGKISEAEIISEESAGAIRYGQLVSSVVSQSKRIGRLFISTIPQGARVRILNIAPFYSWGMELEPGSYHVEVSAPGYLTDSQWVNLDRNEEKRLTVQLTAPPSAPVPVAAPTWSGEPEAGGYVEPASHQQRRFIKMLHSRDLRSKTDAGKLIVREGVKDVVILDVVEEELLQGYLPSGSDRAYVDAMSWLCKALGSSGNSKYRGTLQTVAEKAPHGKLRKYAKKSLDMLR
ncbi:MAG: FlgO family outer membrane protein [Desulfuromonadaceae bacterium]